MITSHPIAADALLSGLPGEALVRQGLADRSADRVSIESCLVEIASPRLERAGLLDGNQAETEPERALYRLLRQSGGDAYSRYNSLLRELVSFEHALDHRLRRAGDSST